MVKHVDPFEGIRTILRELAFPGSRRRHNALTDEVAGQTIDTCLTLDTGCWETGIQRGRNWVIVERYESEDAAHSGHTKWCEALRSQPDMVLHDIDPCGLFAEEAR